MQDILDVTTKLRDSTHSSWDIALKFYESFGFERLVCGVTESATNELVGIRIEMTEDWLSNYASEGYLQIDPWVEKSKSIEKPFIYSFEDRNTCFSEKSNAVETLLRDQYEHQFVNSVLLPPFHLDGMNIGFNLWSTIEREEFYKTVDNSLNQIVLASTIFLLHFKDIALDGLFEQTDKYWLKNPIYINPLSPREKEVLEWLSAGLRNDQIAFRMGITVPTVNFHFQSIRFKLGAKTREQALAIAIVRRFINP